MRDGAHQVGHERQRALQHADEGQLAARRSRRSDRGPELGDLACDLLLGEQDLADVGVSGPCGHGSDATSLLRLRAGVIASVDARRRRLAAAAAARRIDRAARRRQAAVR